MSNGDDVLDNWEEIDEVGLDSKLNKLKRKSQQEKEEFLSTEDKFYDSEEIDQKLSTVAISEQTRLQQSPTLSSSSPLDDMSSFQNTVPLMMVLHNSDNEYQSANYMQPTKSQTVKILRRPTQSTEARGNGMRPKQPIKTLQQREQEYAEARLRILGSAKNPEDDAAEASSTSVTNPTQVETSNNNMYNNNVAINSTSVNEASIYNKMPASQMVAASMWSSMPTTNNIGAGVVVESTAFGSSIMIPQSSQNLLRQQQQENVLRMPKGPDGSMGFQMRR